MLSIKEIDKDHNGYVTRNELDDILKLHYEQELGNRNIQPIINRFCSISNKILIDYKNFKDWIRDTLMAQEVQERFSKTSS